VLVTKMTDGASLMVLDERVSTLDGKYVELSLTWTPERRLKTRPLAVLEGVDVVRACAIVKNKAHWM
jgi:hypothetical protein